MTRAFASIAFTPSVRRIQKQQGSARAYDNFLAPEAEESNRLGEAESQFISLRDGFYQASVSETGWPYVQFRGGPRGFLKTLDDKTIAYADFRGNRQYVSTGNLSADDRISLILMDYPNRARLKIWGRAKIVDLKEDPGLADQLTDPDYRGKPERAVVITIEAIDWNCPQHIPQRLTVEEFQPMVKELKDELQQLRAENQTLRAQIS